MASRMHATPRITVAPSPITSPPSSRASSVNVRVTMIAPWSFGAGGGALVEQPHHLPGHVERLVCEDDEAAGRVQHQVQRLVGRHLLDDRADLLDHLARRALVLLRRATLRTPDGLHER